MYNRACIIGHAAMHGILFHRRGTVRNPSGTHI
jgi:hypothetical protein